MRFGVRGGAGRIAALAAACAVLLPSPGCASKTAGEGVAGLVLLPDSNQRLVTPERAIAATGGLAALVRRYCEPIEDFPEPERQFRLESLRTLGEPARLELLALARDGPSLSALEFLTDLGDRRAIPSLRATAQNSPYADWRANSVICLARLDGAAAVNDVLDGLRSPEPIVVRSAIAALGFVDDPAARSKLRELFADNERRLSAGAKIAPQQDYTSAILDAITRQRDQEAASSLIAAAARPAFSANDLGRVALARPLWAIGTTEGPIAWKARTAAVDLLTRLEDLDLRKREAVRLLQQFRSADRGRLEQRVPEVRNAIRQLEVFAGRQFVRATIALDEVTYCEIGPPPVDPDRFWVRLAFSVRVKNVSSEVVRIPSDMFPQAIWVARSLADAKAGKYWFDTSDLETFLFGADTPLPGTDDVRVLKPNESDRFTVIDTLVGRYRPPTQVEPALVAGSDYGLALVLEPCRKPKLAESEFVAATKVVTEPVRLRVPKHPHVAVCPKSQ